MQDHIWSALGQSSGVLKTKFRPKRTPLVVTVLVLVILLLSAVVAIQSVSASNTTYTPATLSVGGSTLVAPIMADWQTGFNNLTHGVVSVNYQAVGSTSGTNNMLADIFSLGFSDAPIPANGLATLNSTTGAVVTPANSPPATGLAGSDPLIQIPDALAPVSIFYNIPSFRKTLNLTGDIIAEIFLQHITQWNDSRILALNPGLTTTDIANLGKYPISVVHRSDGSGTSFALTYYFGQVDGNWTADGYKAGSTSPTNFPASELSGKGTGGVASLVSETNGAIGYGETSYAIGAGLVYAAVQNQAGNFVLPLPAGATAAAAADANQVATNPVFTITNAAGARSYPISTFTYVFVWENQDLGTSGGTTWTQGLAYDAVQFLAYIVTQGQSYAAALQYAPLPAGVVQVDLGLIGKINYGGVVLYSPTTTTTTSSAAPSTSSSSTTSSSTTSTSSSISSTTTSSTTVPEFPFQILVVALLSVLIAVSYAVVRRRNTNP